MRKACRDQQGRGVTWFGPHFAQVFFIDFDHAATASGISISAAAAAKARLLLLLMLPIILEEAARHTLLDGEHFYIYMINQSFVFPVLAALLLLLLLLQGTRYAPISHYSPHASPLTLYAVPNTHAQWPGPRPFLNRHQSWPRSSR